MSEIMVEKMSTETISWLDTLLATCKQFGVNYYHASEKERCFVEEVARKRYALKQAVANGQNPEDVPPFWGIKRAKKEEVQNFSA